MSERHGEPLAPGDDSGWRIYSRGADGEPRWVQHEPSGLCVYRYSTGYTTAKWGAVGLDVYLHSSSITDTCAEALALAQRHLLNHLARLDGEQRSPDSVPDNGAAAGHGADG